MGLIPSYFIAHIFYPFGKYKNYSNLEPLYNQCTTNVDHFGSPRHLGANLTLVLIPLQMPKFKWYTTMLVV